MDRAGRKARQVEANPNARHYYHEDVDKEDGTARVEVTSVEVKSEEGFCFVATACFGDYDHPTVRQLREFRDKALQSNSVGRRLVALYYRYGRRAAAVVNRHPTIKPCLRVLMNTFARLYTRCDRSR